ncbi:putative PIF1 DNA helicase/replication protein A1-like protein [Tanacetum coccineum]
MIPKTERLQGIGDYKLFPMELIALQDLFCSSSLLKIYFYGLGIKKDGTTHLVVLKSAKKVLPDKMGNSYVKHVTRLLTTLYRLEVVVVDDTAHIVVVMFNDTATELLKCSAESLLETGEDEDDESSLPTAIRNLIGTTHVLEIKSHTYYEYGTFESFTCWKFNPSEMVDDGASSSTQPLSADNPIPSMNRLFRRPSVCTPFKPTEEKKKKRAELEDSDLEFVEAQRVSRYIVNGCESKKLLKFHHLTYTNNDGEDAQKKVTLQIRPLHLRLAKKDTKKATFTSVDVSVTYHNIRPPSHECRNCHATMWYEEREEKSKTAMNPTFSLCCQGGKVLLPTFNDTPPPLNSLLDYNHPATSKFQDQIRVYNSIFCFTSFGAKIDHSINSGRAPYTFRISGQSYHRMGNRQTAFIDKDTSDSVDQQIVRGLIQMLDHYSPIAKAFRMARDWCNTHNLVNFHLVLHSDRKSTRQSMPPTVSEVVAVIINDFKEGLPTRDFVMHNKDSGPRRVSELHPSYMAL